MEPAPAAPQPEQPNASRSRGGRHNAGWHTRERERLARDREARALSLWEQHLTYAQIAAQVGYADAGGAYRAIRRGLRRIPEPAAEDARRASALRLEGVYRRVLEVTIAAKDDPALLLRAVDRLVRLEESYRKLLGLDLASKVEVSGPAGGPVPVEIRAEQVRSRIASLRALPAGDEAG